MALLYEREVTGEPGCDTPDMLAEVLDAEKAMHKNNEYISSILSLAETHSIDVDALIAENSVGWTVDRLSRIDISILRLAIIEMMYMDTPPAVAVNEAVELAKKYSEDKSPKFINGVLAGVIKSREEK